ncbi:MAG: helicase-related protein, partial [Clostridia bacterium]
DSCYGTEKIEEELISKIPNISILRMDRDTTFKNNSHNEILNKFKDDNINVLIGTQMVSKGHDIENVTLVGVLGVDSLLNMNDYLASEKAYSNISQVSGRAGRGNKGGRVIIETVDTTNSILNYALNNDYESFYKDEILFRKSFNYPPFISLLNIELSSNDIIKLKLSSNILYNILLDNNYTVYSPETPF